LLAYTRAYFPRFGCFRGVQRGGSYIGNPGFLSMKGRE
jgi:hypothetical protein